MQLAEKTIAEKIMKIVRTSAEREILAKKIDKFIRHLRKDR